MADTPVADTPGTGVFEPSITAYITGAAGRNLTAYALDPVNVGLAQIGDPANVGYRPVQVAITPSRKLAYVASLSGSSSPGRVLAYELESARGAPIAIEGGAASVDIPDCLAVHPSGRFLFAVEALNDDLDMFTIDPATGRLSANGSINDTGANPNYIAVRPDGRFAYMVNFSDATADVYAFNETTGTLSRVPGLRIALAAGAAKVIKVDPAGQFAFTGNTSETGDSVSAFAIDSVTGALTHAGAQPTGRSPTDLAVAPSGEFIYVANAGDNSVWAYSIAGGTLAAIGIVPTGNKPSGIAVDPSGRFVYVVNELDHTLSIFDVNADSGSLALRGTPLALPRPDGPNSVEVIPMVS